MKYACVVSDLYHIWGMKLQEQKNLLTSLIELTYLTSRITFAQIFNIDGDSEMCLCSFRPVSYQGHGASGIKKIPLRF